MKPATNQDAVALVGCNPRLRSASYPAALMRERHGLGTWTPADLPTNRGGTESRPRVT